MKKHITTILISCLFIGLSVLSFFIFKANANKNELKKDLVEISDIKYGLFNVDEWKLIVADILSKKIEDFELTSKNKSQIREKVSVLLMDMTDDLETKFNQNNASGWKGFFKRKGANFFGIFDEIRGNTDSFTTEIIKFIDDPNNKSAVKDYLIEKLDEIVDNTFAKLDYSKRDTIVNKYNQNSPLETKSYIDNEITKIESQSANFKYFLLTLAILLTAFILFVKNLLKTHFIIITANLFILLLIGIALPMIEIDARISDISLDVMGENVSFKDQGLFYKSKSILEVIRLMMTQGGIDLLIVGFFIFVFSVLFPIAKLLASTLLTIKNHLASNKVIHFLVHKTGKWSMADVMVVAIFMAYIGFSGILTEQLDHIENMSLKIDVLTTNESKLQVGFYAFTAFAVISLLTTSKLKQFIEKSKP